MTRDRAWLREAAAALDALADRTADPEQASLLRVAARHTRREARWPPGVRAVLRIGGHPAALWVVLAGMWIWWVIDAPTDPWADPWTWSFRVLWTAWVLAMIAVRLVRRERAGK